MSIKIVVDSGCDLSVEQAKQYGIKLVKVPLTLQLGDKIFVDNEDLNVSEYIHEMNSHKALPKTAAPSPENYMSSYEGDDDIFVVTISSKLSGSYSSAALAANLFTEDRHDKFIHVFDSLGGSCSEALIALEIQKYYEMGFSNLEIIKKINDFIVTQRTYFILEKLDNLVKTGRLTPHAALLASMLSIKPILGNDAEGNLRMVDKARGNKRAHKKLVDIMIDEGTPPQGKTLVITHCNNINKAMEIKNEILSRMDFKDVLIMEATGLVSNYTQEFGVVVSF